MSTRQTTAPDLVRARAAPLFSLHARRFTILSWLAIGVSYVHQADALLKFSGPGYLDILAALGQTAIIDLALWMLGEYLYEVRAARRKAPWAQLAFGIAVIVSISLNFVYLFTHRPAATVLDGSLSTIIAGVFATFIPLLIGVSGLIRADLARWEQEAAGQAVDLRTAQQDARLARAEATELARQLADAEARAAAQHGTSTEAARLAHAEATAAHARATELARQIAEHERAVTAATRRATDAEARATALAQELAAARAEATALPTRAAVAARLKAAAREMSAGELARATGWKESTLRDWIAAA